MFLIPSLLRYDVFFYSVVKLEVHPVFKRAGLNELLFAECSCISATNLFLLRQRKKIGTSSRI